MSATAHATALIPRIRAQRKVLLGVLRNQEFAHAVVFDLNLPGEPYQADVPPEHAAATQTSLYVWPRPVLTPSSIGIDILRVGEQVLSAPVSFELPLTRTERPTTLIAMMTAPACYDVDPALVAGHDKPLEIRYENATWTLVKSGVARQITGLNARGQPLYQDVDTASYCYRLVCSRCGRTRYAKRNNLHEIEYCWVCTKQLRFRNRALLRYRRHARQGARRMSPLEVDRALALADAGTAQRAIANQLRVTEGAISRLVARHRKAP